MSEDDPLTIEEARRQEAERNRHADELITEATQVFDRLAAERVSNNWADKARIALRERYL